MTSHIREDLDKYNGVQAPDYNVLSYTWGRFADPAQIAISVAGVDWPIPAVQKEHFTADTFKAAIERAASGIRHHCEWLWLDIACIPQRHLNETENARFVRGQEIGRQVDIFRRDKEAFAWLSHLKASDLCGGQPFMTVRDIINQFMQGFGVTAGAIFSRDLPSNPNHAAGPSSTLRFVNVWTHCSTVVRHQTDMTGTQN